MFSQPPWRRPGTEPAIADMLSDPIVHALMKADGVRVQDILLLLRRMNRPKRETPRRDSSHDGKRARQ